ncbi:efflux RND transporter periplasmic adaptor subunit [Sphingobium phenoxybenzoativorans]|uniref:Efflux RND transporter periplasmic adaptor subunit n=1 Tax=Sphingobium phenoxybenzoativorans TaxID=1592790 RepID=A0A975K8H5_9SPHN|nr:efflux RND transporter periplasmic adaptor subunit [Sphingobium phenoxybenzoativorans]QUT06422.1 efflux RND transporter periplasmic adaptor subunit [Sphingobium phenoxybenzoativorans]
MRFSILSAAIAATLLAACSGGKPPAPPPPGVTLATPLQREVTDWDEYVGRFEAVQGVEVMPRVSGQITSINFRAGLSVPSGQLLFQIDPRPYRAALEQAKAQVLRSQAALANAQSEMKRSEELRKFQAVSQEENETKLATLRSAQADLAAAKAAADARALDLSFTSVRAPISGRVSDRRVAIGDYVTAGQTLLTTVVTVDPIWFSFEGAESFYLKYIRQAAKGERASSRYAANPVDIQLADETGYNWHGRMIFVDNAIDNNSGTIRAHAEVPNPKGFLVPGMFGRARLLGSGTYKALLVPDEAIVTDQTRKLVYLVGKDGKTIARPVETGPMVEGLRVIKEGVKPGEKIIIDGLARLQPGMAVTPREGKIAPRNNVVPTSDPSQAPQSDAAKPSTDGKGAR